MLDFNSRRTELVVTALGACLLTASLFTAYSRWDRARRRLALEREVQRSLDAHPTDHDIALPPIVPPSKNKADADTYDEGLIKEQLACHYAFFGEDGMQKVRRGQVVVVGCGGVGSWAAVMLVRSGVSKIRLVDFDYVTLSSLNRHATATLSDVGTPKVKCIEKTLKEIARRVEVDCRIELWRKEDGGPLLQGDDWVIDAIDNITTKVDLLKYCHDNHIKVTSPFISIESCLRFASILIYGLLREQGVSSGIPVVYSTEVPGVEFLPLLEEETQKGDVKEPGVLEDFRVRILPVLGPLPSIFGLSAATYILCEFAEKPISNPLPIKNRGALYVRLLRGLLMRESKLQNTVLDHLPIDEDDVALIFEDVYCGRSIIPPHPVPSKPVLVRWNPLEVLSAENCVVMEHQECEKHLKECFEEGRAPPDVWGAEVAEIVKNGQESIRRALNWIN